MQSYRYSYQTVVRYTSCVTHHHFLLRCTPREDGNQRLIEQDLNLLTPTNLSTSTDNFGNIIHYGSMIGRHDMFVIASSGVVECKEYCIEDSSPNYIFLVETPITKCDIAMEQFADNIVTAGSNIDKALALSSAIHKHMSYTPGITNTQTKAAESFRAEGGVCQDFAHILITLCRKHGVYARYVAGFLIGTGETHAWVEIYDKGAWLGVDPTNNILIVNDYIKVAHGRDAADCSVSRGVHCGTAEHSTEVRVVLEPLH